MWLGKGISLPREGRCDVWQSKAEEGHIETLPEMLARVSVEVGEQVLPGLLRSLPFFRECSVEQEIGDSKNVHGGELGKKGS